ncbi:MAG: 50S ribosomal protein L6 [Chloroflexota bacterium]
MSRVGKLPIPVPADVKIDVQGSHIVVKGPKGTLERDIAPQLSVLAEDGQLRVERPNEEKRSRELHGLTRTLINNMVVGVTQGYSRKLEIQGVGYRAQLVGKKLQLNLGYSHPIEMDPPEGITFELENPTKLAVTGIDKELVGRVAAQVRSKRKPEPYKGKGIRYVGEVVRRKAGKAGRIGGAA